MADQESPGITDASEDLTPTADPAQPNDAEPPALPERIRVHALAKMLGVTSKRIMAQLVELGSTVRSPQSSVNRDTAEAVRDSLEPAASVESPPGKRPAPVEVTAFHGAGEAADAVEAVQDDAAPRGLESEAGQLFTSVPEPHQAPGGQFSAVAVAAPLFLPPDPTAAANARKHPRPEPQHPTEDAPADTGGDTADTGDRDDADAEDTGNEPSRRRRRGRRGRGRGRGEQAGGDGADTEAPAEDSRDAGASPASDSDVDSEAGDEEDAGDNESSSSRRRRRRRRRKVAGRDSSDSEGDGVDDPPNTVVHEREPRSKSRKDEVQGISGSTRLEAKRQRRRDGREISRRRPPILTESEFLARREAVDRVMVVREKRVSDHVHGGMAPANLIQVAVLEDKILVEHFVTSTGSASMVGNIYLGRVQNVLPSMEAAFVDIGRGRNGVLYAGEVDWDAAGLGGRERKIEQALKPGDTVVVQVSKDPVGHKGARLTTQISLAGRFLVYVPGGSSTGISRKLPDTERKRLKEALREIVPDDAGVIIRTASEGVSAEELGRDVQRLQATWQDIRKRVDAAEDGKAVPQVLYEEPDLLVKVVRDLFNEDFSQLVIEGDTAWRTVENYVETVAVDMLARVTKFEPGPSPATADVFAAYRIDEQLAKALDRKVWLPSGGTLVIDRTEAMTVIDVNTGKFTGAGGNLEETVTRNNLEAAEEIVRQMRLRDIGGMIVVDFIDMVLESNRDLVLRRLTECLGRDRTRHQVSEVTSLGLVQMTRKKLGTGLVEAFSTTCEHCHGRGILVHSYPVDVTPVGGEDTVKTPRESGSRRRRGRGDRTDASVGEVAATNGAAEAASAEVEASVKRAHPVALAMAAHHFGEGPDGDGVAVVDRPEFEMGRPQPTRDSADVAEPVAEATSTTEAMSQSEPTPRRRGSGRRRVARAAAAPEDGGDGAVFVVPAESSPPAVVELPELPVPVRPARRRRTAARPAGSPG